MANDHIVIPIDTSLVVLAVFVGIAIGLMIGFFLTEKTEVSKSVPEFTIIRDERGRIVELKGVS